MAEKGASESKSSKSTSSKSKTPAKSGRSTLSSGKGSRSTTKAARDVIDSGKPSDGGNRRTMGIIVGVLVLLSLFCLCSLVILWFTGDLIIEFLNSML